MINKTNQPEFSNYNPYHEKYLKKPHFCGLVDFINLLSLLTNRDNYLYILTLES